MSAEATLNLDVFSTLYTQWQACQINPLISGIIQTFLDNAPKLEIIQHLPKPALRHEIPQSQACCIINLHPHILLEGLNLEGVLLQGANRSRSRLCPGNRGDDRHLIG